MGFSSNSSFLDPPINWPQSANSNNHPHHLQLQESGSLVSGHQVLSHHFPQNPNLNHHHVDATAAATVDPPGLNGSAAEKAKLAKNSQPPPEGPLKCPRCDSANTKFCYFNNYNLTQPRHFCKACRRYWTRGGALRNVPVGGGCRRNKKGKTGNSKSSSSQNKQSTSMVNAPSPTVTRSVQLQTNSQFPFFPTLQNLTQFGGIGLNLAAINGNNGGTGNTSTSFLSDLGFSHGGNTSGPIMGNNNNENNIMTSLGSTTHFALLDRTMGLYSFPNEGNMGLYSSSASRASQTAPVKLEEARLGSISRPVSGLTSSSNQSNQYWTGLGLPGSSSNDHHQNLI